MGRTPERGVFRSTTGGQSFDKVLYKDENIGAADLAFDPSNTQTVYAVLWAARVAPGRFVAESLSFLRAAAYLSPLMVVTVGVR